MGLISITKLKLIEAEVECMKSERILISVSEKKREKEARGCMLEQVYRR
jgi:hypothetical protein